MNGVTACVEPLGMFLRRSATVVESFGGGTKVIESLPVNVVTACVEPLGMYDIIFYAAALPMCRFLASTYCRPTSYTALLYICVFEVVHTYMSSTPGI